MSPEPRPRTAFLLAGIPAGAWRAGAIVREAAYEAAWRRGAAVAGAAGVAVEALEAAARTEFARKREWVREVAGFPPTEGRRQSPAGADPVARDVAATLHGCAAFEAARALGLVAAEDAVAGHSLGLYAALFAAGALDLGAALAVAREAARAIAAEASERPGGLLAVVGLAAPEVDAVARDAGAHVANRNAARQAVLGGDEASLARAERLARERGALDARRLPAGAPLHTPLCERAAARVAALVAGEVAVRAPARPVLAPLGARWLRTAADARDALARNLAAPVRFDDAAALLAASGVRRLVDLGPGDALARLLRLDGAGDVIALDSAREAGSAASWLRAEAAATRASAPLGGAA